jgi:hypothetical protein
MSVVSAGIASVSNASLTNASLTNASLTNAGAANAGVIMGMDRAGQIGPVQLARLLRLPEPTPEQAAVIAAPLGPLAVIAGAGSGKSETMAARLVWLVANGMVRPDRVLGLTFTRKAAAELADRVRSRLERLRRANLEGSGPGPAGAGPAGTGPAGRPGSGDPFDGDPAIGTYHAYAGRLVSDNALREGLEPSMRLITPALSWQLAAGIVAAYDGPMDEIIWTPQTVTAAVLELAGDLAEHLREPEDVTAVGAWLAAERDGLPGRVPASVRKIIATQQARESSATRRPRRPARSLTTPIRWPWQPGSPAGTRRWGRPSGPATRWSCSMSTRTPATRSSCCCARCSAAGIR